MPKDKRDRSIGLAKSKNGRNPTKPRTKRLKTSFEDSLSLPSGGPLSESNGAGLPVANADVARPRSP